MIKLNSDAKQSDTFMFDFCRAFGLGKTRLDDYNKNPLQSQVRAYENLKDLYFDAKAVAITSANSKTFTFMALYPDALYVHTAFDSYRIALNEVDFRELWRET